MSETPRVNAWHFDDTLSGELPPGVVRAIDYQMGQHPDAYLVVTIGPREGNGHAFHIQVVTDQLMSAGPEVAWQIIGREAQFGLDQERKERTSQTSSATRP